MDLRVMLIVIVHRFKKIVSYIPRHFSHPILILNFSSAPVEIVPVCNPNPCGLNSQCRDNNGVAICSCLPEFVGNAPACRPECVVNSECSMNKACINKKCVSPCVGVCGEYADCSVHNHSPFCMCQNGYSGNAFVRCYPITAVESKI